MARIEIKPFAEEHLDAAAHLLADRHRRQRQVEPLLPDRFEDPAVARGEIEAAWRADGGSGLAALDGRRMRGYLVAAPRDDRTWGSNMWIELAGHAAQDAEVVRDLYAAAAQGWVDRGRTSHHVLVPASDTPLVEAWFRLSFGQQHAQGIREVPATADVEPPDGVTLRRAAVEDVEAAVTMDEVLPDHQERSPVFSRGPRPADSELRADWAEGLADETSACFLAEQDGKAVGSLFVAPVEHSGMHSGLARPARACILGYAATVPDVRGAGIGVALTNACYTWAKEQGYATIVTDWRVTNLLSSRFWPKRGFRPSFLRLYRSIP